MSYVFALVMSYVHRQHKRNAAKRQAAMEDAIADHKAEAAEEHTDVAPQGP